MILHFEYKGRYYAESTTLDEWWAKGVEGPFGKIVNPGSGVVAKMGDAWTRVRVARCRESGIFRLRADMRIAPGQTERLAEGSETVFILIRQSGLDAKADLSVNEFARESIPDFCMRRLVPT